MNQIPIDANTVNKTIDILDESTKETRKELDKTGAKGINKLAQLFWASPIGIKADVYIQERPYKLEKELEKMRAKYNLIPAEYQVEPSSYIALKGVNELNYCLEEEHLKEMFQNLLISDMDSRKQSKVKPAYIEIVKQLSKEDAEFLKTLNELYAKQNPLPLITLKHVTDGTTSFNFIGNKFICLTNNEPISIDSIVLDNLLRLKLLEIPNGTYLSNDEIYKNTFEYLTTNTVFKKYNNTNNQHLEYMAEILKITSFGKNFIDICLS